MTLVAALRPQRERSFQGLQAQGVGMCITEEDNEHFPKRLRTRLDASASSFPPRSATKNSLSTPTSSSAAAPCPLSRTRSWYNITTSRTAPSTTRSWYNITDLLGVKLFGQFWRSDM